MVFIDAWRGFAALGVVACHLYAHSPYLPVFERYVPSRVAGIGALGVEVFFVISGFVIAFSLRNLAEEPGGVSRFIIRRQLRLDPPYWVALIIALGLAAMRETFFVGVGRFYTPQEIVASFFYLQRILGTREILSPAWTLCIEIQFYLTFIAILGASMGCAARLFRNPGLTHGIATTVLLATCAVSIWTRPPGANRDVWFMPVWHHFVLGVLACWTLERRLPMGVFWAVAACCAVVIGVRQGDAQLGTGLAASSMFLLVGFAGKLDCWLAGPVAQFFGRMSYSLYLLHVPVGCALVMGVGYKLSGPSVVAGVVWAFAGAAASLIAAYYLHMYVEMPSMRLANRFRKKHRQTDSPTPAQAGIGVEAVSQAVPI